MWQKRCGSSGVAAAADGSSGAGPAVGDQSGINQRVARAFVRVRRPGALTFAAISEVGLNGKRGSCTFVDTFQRCTHSPFNPLSTSGCTRSRYYCTCRETSRI